MVDTDDLGHLWEHLVLGELHAQLGRDPVRYWRTKHGNEVDFVVVRRGRPPIAIECTWAASEFDPAGMKVFRAAYPNGPNFVVSADVSPARPYERATGPLRVRFVALADLAQEIASAGHRVRTPKTTPEVISDESDVDGLVLRDHVEQDDDRVITDLSADLT